LFQMRQGAKIPTNCQNVVHHPNQLPEHCFHQENLELNSAGSELFCWFWILTKPLSFLCRGIVCFSIFNRNPVCQLLIAKSPFPIESINEFKPKESWPRRWLDSIEAHLAVISRNEMPMTDWDLYRLKICWDCWTGPSKTSALFGCFISVCLTN
jgi:hypothetical protein